MILGLHFACLPMDSVEKITLVKIEITKFYLYSTLTDKSKNITYYIKMRSNAEVTHCNTYSASNIQEKN